MMKGKNNWFIQKYMKWTVKSPVTILTIIILGLGSLFYLVSTTNINVYSTYGGVVSKDRVGNLYIEAEIDPEVIIQPVHWYIDRQQAVYQAEKWEVKASDSGYKLKLIVPLNSAITLEPGQTAYIDVPKERITVLSRIVSRGREDE